MNPREKNGTGVTFRLSRRFCKKRGRGGLQNLINLSSHLTQVRSWQTLAKVLSGLPLDDVKSLKRDALCLALSMAGVMACDQSGALEEWFVSQDKRGRDHNSKEMPSCSYLVFFLSVSPMSVHQFLSAVRNEFRYPAPEGREISSLIHTLITTWSVSSRRCRRDAQLSLTGCPYARTIHRPSMIKAPLTVIAERSISRRRCYYFGAKTGDWLRLLTATPPSGRS